MRTFIAASVAFVLAVGWTALADHLWRPGTGQYVACFVGACVIGLFVGIVVATR